MNLDPVTRAGIAWQVIAATVNSMGDQLPPWGEVPVEIRSFMTRAAEAHERGEYDGQSLAAAMSADGWEMNSWNADLKHCVLANTRQGPGMVGWTAASAALLAIKEI